LDREKLLFESYNRAIEKGFDRLFNNTAPEKILKIKEKDITAFLDEELKEWQNTELDILGGITPKKYFDGIDNLDDLIELFKKASKICDVDVPEVLIQRLKCYGEDFVDQLIKLASLASSIEDDEEMLVPLMAIRFLGRLKAQRSADMLLDLLYDVNSENEAIIEEINEAIINIGDAGVDGILNKLSSAEKIKDIEEYLLYSLVQIGANMRKKTDYDDVYACIKETFIKMDDKIIGAICIGDLGDGRAIPFLRGYVEKNMDSIDYDVFCEIKAAVHKLGGNMDDIKFKNQ
jgi:HEAT repeat protein